MGERSAVAAIALLVIVNLRHTEPKGFSAFDDEYYAPRSIAEKGINTTTREEYEPVAVVVRPPFSDQAVAGLTASVTVAETSIRPQRQELCAHVWVADHCLHFGEPAAAAKNKQGEALLLPCGEPRHIGVLQNVRAVLVIADVRHRHSGFMQQRCPLQQPRLRGV